MAARKIIARKVRVNDQVYVIVARYPRFNEQLALCRFKSERRVVSQKIERLAQGSAPSLIPSILRARLASAIAAPTAHAVRAAPCRAAPVRPGLDLHLHRGRVVIEKLGVIRHLKPAPAGFDFERVDERAVAPVEMMPVGLAVGRDIDTATRTTRRALETIDQSLTRRQCAVKRYALGDRSVIEEDGDRATAPVAVKIFVSARGVDLPVVNTQPLCAGCGDVAHALGLMRREDNVAQPLIDQRAEREVVAGRLGQPKRFGLAPETILKISQAPANLRATIVRVTQWKD